MTAPADGWLPIDTAPKRDPNDRLKCPVVLTCIEGDDDSVRFSYWDADGFAKNPRPFWRPTDSNRIGNAREQQPTHWQPRPAARKPGAPA